MKIKINNINDLDLYLQSLSNALDNFFVEMLESFVVSDPLTRLKKHTLSIEFKKYFHKLQSLQHSLFSLNFIIKRYFNTSNKFDFTKSAVPLYSLLCYDLEMQKLYISKVHNILAANDLKEELEDLKEFENVLADACYNCVETTFAQKEVKNGTK